MVVISCSLMLSGAGGRARISVSESGNFTMRLTLSSKRWGKLEERTDIRGLLPYLVLDTFLARRRVLTYYLKAIKKGFYPRHPII